MKYAGPTHKQTRRSLTVVNDALVQKLLHDPDGCVSLRGLLVLDQPINELLGHEAVWVRPEVVPPILDHLALVEPQPEIKKGEVFSFHGLTFNLLKKKVPALTFPDSLYVSCISRK